MHGVAQMHDAAMWCSADARDIRAQLLGLIVYAPHTIVGGLVAATVLWCAI